MQKSSPKLTPTERIFNHIQKHDPCTSVKWITVELGYKKSFVQRIVDSLVKQGRIKLEEGGESYASYYSTIRNV